MTGPRRRPPTLAEAEAGIAATASERAEQCHNADAKVNLEVGAAVSLIGFALLVGWLCLPKEAKHPGNVRLTVSLLLSFATFLTGKALMLLSLNMLGLRQELVSGGQRIAAKCLVAACAMLSVLTMFSLLALLPGRAYRFIGLAVVVAVLLPVAGAAYWYLRRRADRGGASAGEATADEENYREELDAAWKITSCVTTSAFSGLVGVLFSVSKTSGAAARSVTTATYFAIFLMFATAILGMFVMTVSKKVPEIADPPFWRFLVAAVRLTNAVLLCQLASAAFAAAFGVLRYRVFVAFAPLGVVAIVCFLLRYCVAHRGRAGRGNLREENDQDQEAVRVRLKAMEDLASKVATATLGAIMTVLGGALGEKDDSDEAGSTDVFLVVLTMAFVSSFGFMLLTAAPGSARECLAPAAKVLLWSSISLFALTAVAAYGAEVWRS